MTPAGPQPTIATDGTTVRNFAADDTPEFAMSIKATARRHGVMRDPAIKIPELGAAPVELLIDAGQNPDHVPLHDLGSAGKRKCTAGESGDKPCALCAAPVPVRHNWTLSVDYVNTETGVIEPRTLWLDRRDLGRLASVAPDVGTFRCHVDRVEDETAKTTKRDGSKWTIYRFTVASEDDSNDGENDPADT